MNKPLQCFFVFVLLIQPVILQASMIEQLAVDPRAMALGNAVTADPPGHMSIHYNPAGLSNIEEDNLVSFSIVGLSLVAESRFKNNEEWEDFLPGSYRDPLADTKGEVTGFVVYLPGYGDSVTLPTTLALPINGAISTREPESKWTFALGSYSPLIAGVAREGENNSLKYGANSYYWQHLTVTPSVSYQATPNLSFGLSVGMGLGAFGLSTDVRIPNQLVAVTRILGEATEGLAIPPLTDLTLPPPWFGGGVHPYGTVSSMELAGVDNFAPSFNLGFLWEPYDWFAFGAVYHSEIKQELTGNYTMSYSEDWQSMIRWLGSSPLLVITSAILNLPTNPVPYQSGTFSTEMIIPQMVQAGIKVKPFSFLSILLDANWAQWSVVTENRIVFDQPIQALRVGAIIGYQEGSTNFVLKRDLKDTLNFGVGIEIMPLDWLTLRFGYEKRYSSVPIEYFDTIFNFPDFDCYSAGFGLKFKSGLTIDVSATYMKSETLKVGVNESNHMNNTEFTKPIYNPYAGLDYEQNYDIYSVGMKVSTPTSFLNDTAEVIFEKVGKSLSFLNPFD